jgi:ubiquinone/menaquinone biosynthesis C-methylase UbiE
MSYNFSQVEKSLNQKFVQEESVSKRKHYYFEDVLFCEMCGDATNSHKLLGQRLNVSQGLKPWKREGISVSVKQCKKCKLIYASPQPMPAHIQDHYGVPPESYWGENRLVWQPAYFQKEILKAKELLNFHEGMLALDIGAGVGKGMKSLLNAGFDTYGLEPSEPFYKMAIEKMQLDPKDLKLGMVEDADYPHNTFDFISFGAVLEHLYHPAMSIEKAFRWLKPGGVMHIEVPSSKHLIARFINLYYRMVGTRFTTHISPMHNPFHLYEFDLKSFSELSKTLGCTIVHHEYMIGEILYVPGFLKPLFRKFMEITNTGLQLIVWLKK